MSRFDLLHGDAFWGPMLISKSRVAPLQAIIKSWRLNESEQIPILSCAISRVAAWVRCGQLTNSTRFFDGALTGLSKATVKQRHVHDVATGICRQATSRIVVLATVSRKRRQVQQIPEGH